MRVQYTLVIKRPVEQVFAALVNFETTPMRISRPADPTGATQQSQARQAPPITPVAARAVGVLPGRATAVGERAL